MLARVRDTEIYFDIDGLGLAPEPSHMRERRTAFIIHGGPGGDHSSSKAGFGPLADKMQLVYFDHRGHGRSARGDPAKYTLDENVEDMEALRLHLGLGPIVSIGTSYGGVVAMAHAIRYPNSVSHLVLNVTAAHSGFINRARELVAERGTPEQAVLFEDLFGGRIITPEAMQNYFEGMGALYARYHDAPAAKLRLGRAILNPEPFNRVYGPNGCLRNFDFRPQLSAIRCPTLILAGRHDWICPPEFSQEMYEHIQDADLRIFEDSSHALVGDENQQCLDAIAGFVIYKEARPCSKAR